MDYLDEARERERQAIAAISAANEAADNAAVDAMLSLLSAQEEEVVRFRYGLGRPRLKTVREVGEIMGLSRQRVSQIEHKARRRLSWFVRTVGPIGSPAVDRYVIEKRERRTEADRLRRVQAEEQNARKAQRRQEKAVRDDVRRAKARARAWQRSVGQATGERDRGARAKALLVDRIATIEGRGWFARTILPHDSVLTRLRAELVDLEVKIRRADAEIDRLLTSPPPQTLCSTPPK